MTATTDKRRGNRVPPAGRDAGRPVPFKLRVRVLGFLKKPRTTDEVQKFSGLRREAVLRMLSGFNRFKAVARVEWVKVPGVSRQHPKWRLGFEGNLPNPWPQPDSKHKVSAAVVMISTVLELLAEPMTLSELAAELAMAHSSARRVVNMLRAERIVHIAEWQVAEIGPRVAAWQVGDKPNATRTPISTTVRQKRCTFRLHRNHQRKAAQLSLQGLAGRLPPLAAPANEPDMREQA